MTGLKLLFTRYFRNRIILTIFAVFYIIMMAAVVGFHAEPDTSEQADYLMCKLCMLYPSIFAAIFPAIYMSKETVGSRFMLSVPCAEKMYTVGIPLFSSAVATALILITNIVYAAFILITGRDLCNISDSLIISGIMCFFIILCLCALLSLRLGGLMLAAMYIPIWLVLMITDAPLDISAEASSFRLPLWKSVLILTGVIIVGAILGGIISKAAYRFSNFKENKTMMTWHQ